MMYRQHFWHGNGIVRGTAISGIDIALWDILGKVHGVPCHKLWGGPVRDYVRLYCHLGGGQMEDFYESSEPRALRRAARRRWSRGIHRLQVDGRPADDAARGAGADPLRGALRRGDARRGRRRHRHHGRLPRPPEPADGTCSSRRRSSRTASTGSRSRAGRSASTTSPRSSGRCSTPIATGERLVGAAGVRRAAEKGACSVIQPDITHCGGLTEARRIAAMAEAYRVALAPHNPQGPVSTAASLELGLATPSYIICEAVTSDVPWRSEVAPRVASGGRRRHAGPPEQPSGPRDRDRPGRRCAASIRAGAPAARVLRDGSVGDW